MTNEEFQKIERPKLEVCSGKEFFEYEVSIAYCIDGKYGNETHKFSKIGQAKEYLETDYVLKWLKGTIQFYNGFITKKSQADMYKIKYEEKKSEI